MESPKFNISRGKKTSPLRPYQNKDLSLSDSFTNHQVLLTNNTPDYLNPSKKSSKNLEFTSSVQEFLKQSTEIQDEIRKLSEICQQISPKFSNGKSLETPENPDWEKINDIVRACKLPELEFDGDEVKYESLVETFIETIYEYSAQIGISEQAKNEYGELEKTVIDLTERNKYLEQKIEKIKTRKGIESEIRELEKISKSMENKFRKMKESLKEKNKVIRDLRRSLTGETKKDWKSVENSTLNERVKEVFMIFIGREAEDRSKTDKKILNLIEMYEKKEGPEGNDLQVILDELEASSPNEGLLAIAKLKQEMSFSAEHFLQDLYHEVYSKSLTSHLGTSLQAEMLSKINDFKNNSQAFENFKEELKKSFSHHQDINDEDMVGMVKIVGYFCKLFQIEGKDDELKVIQEIYCFVHEIKLFLQQARNLLRKESISLSGLLDEITKKLGRT